MKARVAALLVGLSLAACGKEVPYPEPPAARATAAATVSAVASVAPPAPAEPFSPKRIALEEKAMGTHVLLATFTTEALDEEALKPKLLRAFAEIRRLERLMTTWRDDSEISLINAAAGKAPVEVGPESLAVIEKSIWISKASEGVFDITFEAMHGLWKFDQDLEESVPSKGAIEAVRRRIDYRKIKVDHEKRTVMLEGANMKMSLGGIAKGYAVDVAARVLREEGITSFFVQAGGDLFVEGKKPDGTPYRVGIRDPRGRDENDFFARIDVEDHAFSTAGDYERSFIKDKKRYHHIIDPRTGYPATASRSVTIWAKDAFTADAVDDAVFILGPEKGLALVESIDDCGAVIVDAKNKVWISKRLEGRVEVFRPPTDGI